jgi:hypothetical protein
VRLGARCRSRLRACGRSYGPLYSALLRTRRQRLRRWFLRCRVAGGLDAAGELRGRPGARGLPAWIRSASRHRTVHGWHCRPICWRVDPDRPRPSARLLSMRPPRVRPRLPRPAHTAPAMTAHVSPLERRGRFDLARIRTGTRDDPGGLLRRAIRLGPIPRRPGAIWNRQAFAD